MVVLFALIGASLNPLAVWEAAPLALAFAGVRLLTKTLAMVVTAAPSGLSPRKGFLLGLSLSPMSGLAVVLVEDAGSIYPNFSTDLLVIVLATVTLMQLVGPVLTSFSLRQARENRSE
jgi:Kef-type K+ transport system membrane component KefB